ASDDVTLRGNIKVTYSHKGQTQQLDLSFTLSASDDATLRGNIKATYSHKEQSRLANNIRKAYLITKSVK
ncbi:2697_t:CDS:2, partial [Funneliformis mosseae]